MSKGVIKKVAGPLVIASGMRDANMFEAETDRRNYRDARRRGVYSGI